MRQLQHCIRIIAIAMPMLLAAACQRESVAEAQPAAPVEAPALTPAELQDRTAGYACNEGNRVDVLRDRVARVALNDGKVVMLELIGKSTPPTFTDNGLTFVVLEAERAELSDEHDRALACTADASFKPGESD